MTTAILATVVVAMLLLGLLVVGLLRSHAEILRRLHDLDGGDGSTTPLPPPTARTRATGRPAADLVGTTPSGEAVAMAIVGAPDPTVLVFLSTGCTTCARFWTALAGGRPAGLPDGARIVAVVKDAAEESPSALAAVVPAGVSVVQSTAAFADFQVPGVPYVVLADGPTGRVTGEGTGAGWDQVVELLSQADADGPAGAARIDGELRAAGIEPGDTRLWPPSIEAHAEAEFRR